MYCNSKTYNIYIDASKSDEQCASFLVFKFLKAAQYLRYNTHNT